MRVLVVDDDEPTRMICRRVLERIAPGVRVEEATDGASACERIRAERFDGILCDYRMGAVSGLEVLATALAEQPSAYRALMTGFTDPALADTAREQGTVHAFIEKPMTSREFEDVLKQRFLDPMSELRRPAG